MRRPNLSTSLPSPEASRLYGPVPSDFERFYRRFLRYRSGCRVRTMDLARRYAAWAEHEHAQSINLRHLRRAMERLGHRHFHANGTHYADVEFALPEGVEAPASGVDADPAAALLSRLDTIAAELAAIRARVAVA